MTWAVAGTTAVVVVAAALGAWPCAAMAQVMSGGITRDRFTSLPVLKYTDACSEGTFGEDYGVNEVCFFEKEHFAGGCVCVGPKATRRVAGAFRLRSSEIGSVRVAPGLAVNVVLDDFRHKIRSHRRDQEKRAPANYIVVSEFDSVCVFKGINYEGPKHCQTTGDELEKTPFTYQSLMVVPTTGGCVQAEIRPDKFVRPCAAQPGEIEHGGPFNISEVIEYSKYDDLAKARGPYKRLRVLQSPPPDDD